MKLIDDYFDIQRKIYKSFNYEDEWHIYPLDDLTDRYWTTYNKVLYFGDTKKSVTSFIKNGYDTSTLPNDMFSYTMLDSFSMISTDKKWSMIKCDTEADDNLVLAVLDNTKQVT